MKVLTADTGQREGDFTYTVPGELVTLTIPCDRDLNGDRGCGCGRAFAGLASGKCTTVAVVRDLELTYEQLHTLVDTYYRSAGWDVDDEFIDDVAEDLADEAESWPEGTRLRRELDEVTPE